MSVSWLVLRFLNHLPRYGFSRIKSRLYRGMGAEVGEHVYFAPGSFVCCSDFKRIRIGDGAFIGRGVNIFCDQIEIGDDTIIDSGVHVAGSSFKIGKSCFILSNAYIDCTEPVTIEDDVGIGADYIFTHSVWHPITEGGPRKFAPVNIKRGAWIPAGVFIMPGVTVGEYATIGARSLVMSDIPARALAVGIPAKIVKGANQTWKQPSLTEKDAMIRDILMEFSRCVKGTTSRIPKTIDTTGFRLCFRFGVRVRRFLVPSWRTCHIVYVSTGMSASELEHIQSLSRDAASVLLVSLPALPDNLVKTLNSDDFSDVIWFDVTSRTRKRSWRKEALALHNFFRSRYGIRFRF